MGQRALCRRGPLHAEAVLRLENRRFISAPSVRLRASECAPPARCVFFFYFCGMHFFFFCASDKFFRLGYPAGAFFRANWFSFLIDRFVCREFQRGLFFTCELIAANESNRKIN